MAEIVNLRMARKRKRRSEAEAIASANRAKHGVNRADRERSEALLHLETRSLAAHRREDVDRDR